MGKPMGQHPHTRYIIPNPKKDPKRVRDPMISSSSCALPSIGYRSPKIGQIDQGSPKTWSRANRPPTLTCDSSRVTLIWVVLLRTPRDWLELLRLVFVPWPPLQ
jgi:hypothetical protein